MPRKTCVDCALPLEWENLQGIRLYREENGVRVYSARCPVHGVTEIRVPIRAPKRAARGTVIQDFVPTFGLMDLVRLLVAACRVERRPEVSSMSFGSPAGTFLVLVALTPERVAEVEAMIPTLSGAGDPIVAALRAEVALLQQRVAALQGMSGEALDV